MQDIVDKIKDLLVLYDEYGSEMSDGEINFLDLIFSKAMDKGLTVERLTQDEVDLINRIHRKYSTLDAFDSDEGDGDGGL